MFNLWLIRKFDLGLVHLLICLGLALLPITPTGAGSRQSVRGQPSPPLSLARELYLFNWQNYISPEVLKDFEREFGVRIIEDNFASNEELLAKLQAGAGGYDVVVPSDYMVRIMIRQNLLAPLNHQHLPNLKNISASFRNLPYDPENRFSVPYLWGATGIGYNRAVVAPPPASWDDLFNPEKLRPYSGRISMLNDMREVIGAALIYLGFPPSSIDPSQLQAAKEVLLRQKPFLAKYDSEAYEDSLAAKETVLAHGWSGEFFTAQQEDPDLGFVIPKEGSFLFVDNLVIPKGSKRQITAEIFINYLLRADVAARNSSFLGYATANEAGRALIDPKLTGARYTLPVGIKFYSIEDLGEAGRLYEQIWTELKAR